MRNLIKLEWKRRGRKIKSLKEIKGLAENRRSVVIFRGDVIPAAIIFQMSGRVIEGFLESGVWVYNPKERKKAKWG